MPKIREIRRPNISLEASDSRRLVVVDYEEDSSEHSWSLGLNFLGHVMEASGTVVNQVQDGQGCGPAVSQHIDEEVDLRGLPLGTLLSSAGQKFDRASSIDAAGELFQSSMKVKSINEFMSHCWDDHARLKWLAMLWHINRRFALVASTALTAVWLAAEAAGYQFPTMRGKILLVGSRKIDNLCWGYAPLLYIATSILVFFCGHALRAASAAFLTTMELGSSEEHTIFFDQACIDQHDHAKKEKAIRNLGDTLMRSEQLSVVWSSNLLSRAWCAFELARWLSLKGLSNIEFLHLPVGMMWILSLLAQILQMSVLSTNDVFSKDFWAVETGWQVTASVFIIWRTLDVLDTEQRLEQFSLQMCECTCCKWNHVHPDTGARMDCDKVYILDCASRWFSVDSGNEETLHGVEAFEHRMSTEVPKVLAWQVGPAWWPFNLQVYFQVYAATFLVQALETFILNNDRPFRMRLGIALAYFLCILWYFVGFVVFHHMVLAFDCLRRCLGCKWGRAVYYVALLPVFVLVDVIGMGVCKRIQACIIHPVIWGSEVNLFHHLIPTQGP